LIRHHDGCFGCGPGGLQIELERRAEGVAGRFYVRPAHQGPPGYAHGGIVATALDEAMSLLLHDRGIYALTTGLDVRLRAPAPIDSYVGLEAWIDSEDGRRIYVGSRASGGDPETEFATAGGVFVRVG
jgi:acyl-coenzyme A thioesterase PaaI-like protein